MNEDILWGVELSCFALKLQACMQYSGRAFRRLPDQGSYIENTRTLLALEYAKSRKLISRFPHIDAIMDEYPSVPFLWVNGKHFQYDSSSIACWLDSINPKPEKHFYPEDAVMNFIACLIDEAFDEFGLYMVHHMRWIGSAKSNQMGKLLGNEFRHALPPGGSWLLSRSFPKRQVRRCPYLFSVAPKGYRSGMSRSLNPPSREGFPETHTLLNESWRQYLKGMETILSEQAYLLGNRFTIADASAYGQLGMNLVDPEAAEKLEALAPVTFNWLTRIHQKQHCSSDIPRHQKVKGDNKLYLNKALKPLLNTIMNTFSALMVQNAQAYKLAKENGATIFNEAAFNQGQSLYDGKLRGYPFRGVVKTFQVRVWQELCEKWQALSEKEKAKLQEVIPLCEMFET